MSAELSRCPTFPFPLIAARPAMPPPASIEVRVGRVEPVAVDAIGLQSVDCGLRSRAAEEVFSPRNRLQMQRVYATSVPAEVVKLHSLGDRADEMLIGVAMSGPANGLAVSVVPESPVASGPRRAGPQPTFAEAGLRYLTAEPRPQGRVPVEEHDERITVDAPPPVVHLAEPSPVIGAVTLINRAVHRTNSRPLVEIT